MDRFVVDEALLAQLDRLQGNVAALHRELVAGGRHPSVPSPATLHRALKRARSDLAGSVAPPDPGGATTVDELVERLRLLRAWAGDPSFSRITESVNVSWSRAGRPESEFVGRSTVVDCFRPGRRRLNADLVMAVVLQLCADPGYVAQWHQALLVVGGERRAAAQVRVRDELPPDLPGFTGRSADLRRLRHALSAGGPVVISAIEGMAGVGKTRLAVHAAHLVHREQPFAKVLFVNLRGFHPDPSQPPADPAAVLDGFLRLLGVPGPNVPHTVDARARLYRDLLAGIRALIVLDNAADTDQVRPLLPGTPGSSVLITSRRSLASLSPATAVTVGVFSPDEAVRFLARGVGPAAVRDDAAAAARIAELCGHLPLALGVVAGHIRARDGWSLADHADRLQGRQREHRLDDGVELALDLSYQRLEEGQRRLLRLLALHPADDFDVYAAAALTGSGRESAGAGLRQLSDDHLIQRAGGDRYTLHDLVRTYATVRADDEERPRERRAALTRLFDYYLGTVATALKTLNSAEASRRPDLPPAVHPAPRLAAREAAIAWLEAEHATLTAVVAYGADQGWPAHSVRLASILQWLLLDSRPRSLTLIHQHAIRAARLDGDLRGQARALVDVGVTYSRLGQHETAAGFLERGYEMAVRAGDLSGQARACTNLGAIATSAARYEEAIWRHEQALGLWREAGDRLGETGALNGLGLIQTCLGDFDAAIDYLTRSLAVAKEVGNEVGIAMRLLNIGEAEVAAGRLDSAERHLAEALPLYRQFGNRAGEGGVLDELGRLHSRRGENEQAIACHQQALNIVRELGNPVYECGVLNNLGEAERALGWFDTALVHHEAALAIASDVGARDQQARAHAGIGATRENRGDRVAAREAYEHALKLFTSTGRPEADAVRARLAAL